MQNPKISIIVPVYNSVDFIHALTAAIEKERIAQGWNLELLLIDDGSRDASYQKIKEYAAIYPYIKIGRAHV